MMKVRTSTLVITDEKNGLNLVLGPKAAKDIPVDPSEVLMMTDQKKEAEVEIGSKVEEQMIIKNVVEKDTMEETIEEAAEEIIETGTGVKKEATAETEMTGIVHTDMKK